MNKDYIKIKKSSKPAFEESLHVGRPNIGDKELFFELANEMFENNWLTNNGPFVQELEEKIANFVGVKNCIAMCNGTIALEIAIRALELTGEVILPSFTFIATAHALSWQGIKPVFADISANTHTLSPKAVKKVVTDKTSGIIGVHLWGRAAPIEELEEIASEYGLKLLFDAAHAFGCSYKGQRIGAFGECEVFSFHATKFFNTFEGGAVVTNNDELAEKLRLMRNFGFSGMDNVIHSGVNGKMTEISAIMGLVNFKSKQEVIKKNYKNYLQYCEHLSGINGIDILRFDESEENNFQYIVLMIDEKCKKTRNELLKLLHKENILARRYFWPGCHKMVPYKKGDYYDNLLPITKKISEEVLLLPTGSSLGESEIEKICRVLKKTIAS